MGITLLVCGFWYLVDCQFGHRTHPEVPWIMSGVYANNAFGFIWTFFVLIAGLISGIYHFVKASVSSRYNLDA